MFSLCYIHVYVCKWTSQCDTYLPSVGRGWRWTGLYNCPRYLFETGFQNLDFTVSAIWAGHWVLGICLSLHHRAMVTSVYHHTQLLFCGYWGILTRVLVHVQWTFHPLSHLPLPRDLFKVGWGEIKSHLLYTQRMKYRDFHSKLVHRALHSQTSVR